MGIHSLKVSNGTGLGHLMEVSRRLFAAIPGAEFALTIRPAGTSRIIEVGGDSPDDIPACLRVLGVNEEDGKREVVRFDLHVFQQPGAAEGRARRYRSRQALDAEVSNLPPVEFTGYPEGVEKPAERTGYLLQLILDHLHLTPLDAGAGRRRCSGHNKEHPGSPRADESSHRSEAGRCAPTG